MAEVMEKTTSKMEAENFTISTHRRKRKADSKITSDTKQKKCIQPEPIARREGIYD